MLINLVPKFPVDALVFEEGERGPKDDFKLQFEAVSHMPPEDQQAVKMLLDGIGG